jgi:hypothetical protein
MSDNEKDHEKEKAIEIIVNKKTVTVTKHKITGLEVKQAAIDAGVQIQLTHQLALIKEKKRQIIGDTDEVKVENGTTFVATASDDNS